MDKEHNCCGGGCGCDEHENHEHHDNHEHHEHEVDTLTLTLEDDSELECYVLGIFDAEDREYIALLPVGEEDVYLYRYSEGENEEAILDTIEDDDEYDRIGKVFMELCDEAEEVKE